jgi:hypothetical protein
MEHSSDAVPSEVEPKNSKKKLKKAKNPAGGKVFLIQDL